MPADDDDYTPEKIEYYLAHWDELQAAAEGGTGSLNGSGGGNRDRLALACLLADLERAADALPAQWTATREVYRLQRRAARAAAREEVGLQTAIFWMARRLGWTD